jgi:hypothetical protein
MFVGMIVLGLVIGVAVWFSAQQPGRMHGEGAMGGGMMGRNGMMGGGAMMGEKFLYLTGGERSSVNIPQALRKLPRREGQRRWACGYGA